jgi:hypothetical protein
MAYTRGRNVHRATANTVTSMKASAEKRQCPTCGRKSALVFVSDDYHFGHGCRWPDCGYERFTVREYTD